MEKYLIYKITNLKDGRAYVGRTKNIKRRIREHIQVISSSLIHQAILEQGISNFSIQILEEELELSEAKKIEGELIDKLKTLFPEGYNLMGETQGGREMSERIKKLMSLSQQKRARHNPCKKFLGTKKNSGGQGYSCRVRTNGRYCSKTYETEERAAEAYDKLVLVIYGKDAQINFENKREEYLELDLKNFFKEFLKKKKSSEYKGVSFDSKEKKWRAYYGAHNGRKYLGRFETESEAYSEARKYYKNAE